MQMYRLDTWRLIPDIVSVECERVTDKYVFIKGRKRARESSDTKFFDDFNSAESASIEYVKNRIINCKNIIKIHEANISNYESYLKLKENNNV